MSALEVQILHLVNHRSRSKTLADICLVLNIEDTHLANYAIKKLAEHKLVTQGRLGKEKTVAATPAGETLCLRYREVREALLVTSAVQMGVDGPEISRLAALLRAMSGEYDHAARAAAAL